MGEVIRIKTNYVQFDNDIIVDTLSNMPIGASQRGMSRIVGCPITTLVEWLNKGDRDFTLIDLQVHTPGGLQGVRVIPFSAFKQVFIRFNPTLLESAADYGLAVFTLKMAGYNPEPKAIEQPWNRKETELAAYQAATRLTILEMAIEDFPGQVTINNKLIDAKTSQLALPEAIIWLSAKEYLDSIDYKIDRKHQWNFTRACTNLHRLLYQQEAKKVNGVSIYPSKMFVYFETWLGQLVS